VESHHPETPLADTTAEAGGAVGIFTTAASGLRTRRKRPV